MRTRGFWWVALSVLVLSLGCGGGDTASNSGSNAGGDDHGHDHEEGPHGGHLVELGDEEYHLEWTHDDKTGRVTVYVLGAEAKADVAIAAETLTIVSTLEQEDGQSTDPQSYPLAAQDAEDGKASKFELEDAALVTRLLLSEGVDNSVKLTIDGKEFTGFFEHQSHGHKH